MDDTWMTSWNHYNTASLRVKICVCVYVCIVIPWTSHSHLSCMSLKNSSNILEKFGKIRNDLVVGIETLSMTSRSGSH